MKRNKGYLRGRKNYKGRILILVVDSITLSFFISLCTKSNQSDNGGTLWVFLFPLMPKTFSIGSYICVEIEWCLRRAISLNASESENQTLERSVKAARSLGVTRPIRTPTRIISDI